MKADAHGSANERRAHLLGKAVTRASEALGLKQYQLAQVLGVSESSASRLASGDYVLPVDSKAWEFALLLVRIYRSLDAIVGSRQDAVRAWMHSSNRAVNGVPAQLVTSAEGMVRVLNYLDANRGLV